MLTVLKVEIKSIWEQYFPLEIVKLPEELCLKSWSELKDHFSEYMNSHGCLTSNLKYFMIVKGFTPKTRTSCKLKVDESLRDHVLSCLLCQRLYLFEHITHSGRNYNHE